MRSNENVERVALYSRRKAIQRLRIFTNVVMNMKECADCWF